MKSMRVIIFISAFFLKTSTSDPVCTTPTNEQGICTSLANCPSLNTLLKHGITEEETSHLRKFHCGFVGKHPKVCCSTSSSANNVENVRVTSDLLPKSRTCGHFVEDRILTSDAQLDQYPWTALLKYEELDQERFYCGGTLISNRYVLTAASCIKGRSLPEKAKLTSVRFGEHNLQTYRDCWSDFPADLCADPVVDVSVEEVIVHEGYSPNDANHHHDIALIRLNTTVSYTDFIAPVCLPTSVVSLNKNYSGVRLSEAGWGIPHTNRSTNSKKQGSVVAHEPSECNKNFNLNLNQQQFCGTSGWRKACAADIGASAVDLDVGDADVAFMAGGIASAGSCEGDPFTVYTKVSSYVRWIVGKLRK